MNDARMNVGIWMDDEVNQKLLELNGAICSFERATGCAYTLVLIPHDPSEKGYVSLNGKWVAAEHLETAIRLALDARYGVGKGERP